MNDQINNIKFVEEVEKHEILYNFHLPGYSRKDQTEKAWHEVATKTNMTVVECREKWRNLRTVFIRKMKTLPSGSGRNKKAYYLADAMQFSIPFIKTLVPPSTENLLTIPQYKTADTLVENAVICDDINLANSKSPPPTPPPLQALSKSPEKPVLSQQINRPEKQSSSSRIKIKLSLKNKSEIQANKCVAEYFKAKKARLEETLSTAALHNNEHKEAFKLFLLSLISEVEHFNNDQIKLFKRKIFNVIDDISSQPQPNSYITIHSSQQTATSHTPDISASSNTFEYYADFHDTKQFTFSPHVNSHKTDQNSIALVDEEKTQIDCKPIVQ